MNREIQQHITSIYNALDDFDNTRDLLEIRYWLLSSNLGKNDNFLVARFNIEKQKISVNRCKQLVLVEREKDPKFARAYDKYHKKLGS